MTLNRKNKLLTLLYILGAELAVPVTIILSMAFLFFKVGQAAEVLYGTIGPQLDLYSNLNYNTARKFINPPVIWFTFAVITFAIVLYYSSQLILIYKKRSWLPAGFQEEERYHYYRCQTARIPHLISAIGCMIPVAAIICAQSPPPNRGAIEFFGFAAVLLPFFYVLAITTIKIHRFLNIFLLFSALASSWFFVIKVQPYGLNFAGSVISYLSVLAYFPALCMLPILSFKKTCRLITQAEPFDIRNSALIPFRNIVGLLVFVGFAVFTLLYILPPSLIKHVGSAAIVVYFSAATIALLTLVFLLLRHLFNGVPNIFGLVVLSLFWLMAFFPSSFGDFLLSESFGDEMLIIESPPKVLPTDMAGPLSTRIRDVVINAHGGGLRAALFTGAALARLDDRTCGQFGNRIHSLSGVSGGSLGIATYLAARQKHIADGGWKNCKVPNMAGVPLTDSVQNILVQDHLSVLLAKMLSIDLLPGKLAYRGSALLHSWHDAFERVTQNPLSSAHLSPPESQGFAQPLQNLTGGIFPKPEVYFNMTDVKTGVSIWLSNYGKWGNTVGDGGPLKDTISVGKAVLDSARFPLVSPAGFLDLNNRSVLVIDGGLADNSGANTLALRLPPDTQATWLDIDGNAPERQLPDFSNRATWSGLTALMSVRESQAVLATKRLSASHNRLAHLLLKMDYDAAFEKTIVDSQARQKFLEGLRNVPLGWYLSFTTAGEMQAAVFNSVAMTCKQMKSLCVSEVAP